MGTQRQIKNMRRQVKKAQNVVVTNYVRQNWDAVIRSSLNLIRTWSFKNRFRIAMLVLFVSKKEKAALKAAAGQGQG
ncbi:MAG: hypothetical protein Pg6C_16740 [Treponemataceae bacterium]|nr:MAG: hypothetical protein Pg6C_16740 [Treponemataceae bacterium]